MKIYGTRPVMKATIMLFLIMPFLSLAGQTNGDVMFMGWEDDTHYLLRNSDSKGNVTVTSVNIKTGKGTLTVPQKTGFEVLVESMANFDISRTDPVAPNLLAVLKEKENDLYLAKSGNSALIRLTDDKDKELNARFSPGSDKIAYTKNNDLYVFDLNKNIEKRVTSDGTDKVYNGYAAWVYMEEILGRASNYAAFWWSPDGQKIAFLRTDETDIPVYTLNRLDTDEGLYGKLEVVPYPKAGEPTPKVKMGIADMSTGIVTWVKTDYSVDQYLAWPFWTPDSKSLAIQIVNRDQNDLQIILADATNGDFSVIYRESNKTWVEFREDIYVMSNGSGFIIRSYKNGWENLYYYDWSGKLISQLTDFGFRVSSIEGVDEKNGIVYFTATGEESTDNHFYRVGLDGKNLVQISNGEGTHSVDPSPNGTYFADTWNSVSSKGAIVVYDKNGKQVKEIANFSSSKSLAKSELKYISTADGLFEMPAIITYPVDFDPNKKYPVIFKIYGGPDYKNVYNRWQGSEPSWYSQNGIITFTVDHRGSGHFGKKGLDYLYRNLGKWEILDYIDAVKYLNSLPYVDSSKIGITGSSYGGYMTCMALTKGGNYWTHGFAGSSVTDWRLYDNVYTERFMDTPQDNKEGYDNSSALTWASMLKGKFYLNHGDIDDNVHLQNSIQLISRLEDEGKEFKFMLYPNERHGFSSTKRAHSQNEERNFWLDSFFDK